VGILICFLNRYPTILFAVPPAFFFFVSTTMLPAHLSPVEVMKQWFFRRFAVQRLQQAAD
jgi:hypothetical protein